MTMKAFIKANRSEIDAAIRAAGARGSLNDEDREDWILNDEGLYSWARSEGVRL